MNERLTAGIWRGACSIWAALTITLVAACGDSGAGAAGSEADVGDEAPPRRVLPDGVSSTEPDTSPSTPDVAAEVVEPDASIPDVSEPDVSIPDASEPDVSIPDVSEPDVSIPDVSEPDVSIPDTSEPDVSVPDVSEPDVSAPDTGTSGGGTWCDDPIVLSLGMIGASAVVPENRIGAYCAASSTGGEAFYSFTAPSTGEYCFDTAGSAASDTVLVVGTGCTSADEQLNCVDDVGGSLQASGSHYLREGETVFAVVSPYSGNADVRLTVNAGACPDTQGFETCAHPFVISTFEEFAGPAFEDNANGSCSGPTSSYEAVIAFEASASGPACVNLSGTDDVVLYARSSCRSTDELACVDARADGSESMQLDLVAGETTFLFLEDYATGIFESPVFTYSVQSGPCP